MKRRRPTSLRVALVVIAAVLSVISGPVFASPADAHAIVVASSPTDGSRLDAAPSSVSVTFSEDVTTELGGLEVRDATGARVDIGELRRPTRTQLEIDLRSDVGSGAYVTSYRVVGVDDHTIVGSLTFTVGDVTQPYGRAGATGDPSWEGAAAASRGGMYLGSLLAAGGTLFLMGILRGPIGRRESRRAIDVAVVVGLIGLVGWCAAEVALATGRGAQAITDPAAIEVVLRETMGWPAIATLVGLIAVPIATRVHEPTAAQVVGFYGAVSIWLGYLLWGHPRSWEPTWLAVTADGLHAAAASVWFGGLAALAIVLGQRSKALASLPATDAQRATVDPAADNQGAPTSGAVVETTARTVVTFSQVAAVSLVAVWIAGLAMALLALDGPSRLVGTRYGTLVLLKTGLVGAAVAVAAWNRRTLLPNITGNAMADGDDTSTVLDRWRQLRRSVLVEAGLLVLVVAVTGVLVATPPRDVEPAAPQTQPIEHIVPIDGTQGSVRIRATAVRDGDTTIELTYLDQTGQQAELVQSVAVKLQPPVEGAAPIERDARRVGPGQYQWTGAAPIPGTWRVTITSRVTQFEQKTTTFDLTIP